MLTSGYFIPGFVRYAIVVFIFHHLNNSRFRPGHRWISINGKINSEWIFRIVLDTLRKVDGDRSAKSAQTNHPLIGPDQRICRRWRPNKIGIGMLSGSRQIIQNFGNKLSFHSSAQKHQHTDDK